MEGETIGGDEGREEVREDGGRESQRQRDGGRKEREGKMGKRISLCETTAASFNSYLV